ncbi:MAG: AAA family ATPase [Anaerolineae bacterium]|nr:AAA family ATPase [Anaerolineae bacterium]
MVPVKRIPYGVADYGRMKRQGMYYVDKTHFIPLIEAAPFYLFLIRPRRFGKSLWLSVLQHYYDVNHQQNFETLFGDTYIGTHPTEERNSYLILAFNFAVVNPDVRYVHDSFDGYGRQVVKNFLSRYTAHFTPDEAQHILEYSTADAQLRQLFFYAAEKKLRIYLLVDEYDNFANTILTTQGETAYQELTHGGGFFRYFFNLLKGATSGMMSGLSRIFITGVSPITMDDVTSGFNIGDNISLGAEFNQLLGFTETETTAVLEYYQDAGLLSLDIDEYLHLIREWYGYYRFSDEAEGYVFNSDMVLYFIKESLSRGTLPKRLLDSNVRTDYSKLRHLLTVDRRLNGNFSRLREIIESGEITATVAVSFPLERLVNTENFVSLLFYMGLLTFNGIRDGRPVLRIPNLTIRELLYGYLREGYYDTGVFRINMEHFAQNIARMAYHGEWEPVLDFLAQEIEAQTSIRDYLFGEKVIQGFLLAYLNVTNYFLTWSEREMGSGFADIYLEPFLARYPDIPYGYLIELKYIPRGEDKSARLETLIPKAETQLRQYLADTRIQAMSEHVIIKGLVLVYHGWELVYQAEV